MKKIFDELSFELSKKTTQKYSTSFSLGILAIKPSIRNSIYAIYGFVRLADEIVDSFHGYDKIQLLNKLKKETYNAIDEKISLNPIIHSFQEVVNKYGISLELIEQFLHSMEMDLESIEYNSSLYNEYIHGSAEVVGLMCLQVFLYGDREQYIELKPYAMKLGAAFQKINFLRDLKDDYNILGRIYFPHVNIQHFDDDIKREIEYDIYNDFKESLVGIKKLPSSSKFGVYLAYKYYYSLFKKIQKKSSLDVLNNRIRIHNSQKVYCAFKSYIRYKIAYL